MGFKKSGYHPYRNKEWLMKEHVEKRRTYREIALECGVDKDLVRYYGRKYKLTKKPHFRKQLPQLPGQFKRFQLYLPSDLYKALADYATSVNSFMSDVARGAIYHYLRVHNIPVFTRGLHKIRKKKK